MRHARLAVAITLLLLVPLASARTVSVSYVGTGAGANTELATCAADVGGACFAVLAGETRMSVLIQDDTGLRVGALWRAFDAQGAVIGLSNGFFCGSTSDPLPAGTVRVAVDIVATGSCLWVGTTGTITATFT